MGWRRHERKYPLAFICLGNYPNIRCKSKLQLYKDHSFPKECVRHLVNFQGTSNKPDVSGMTKATTKELIQQPSILDSNDQVISNNTKGSQCCFQVHIDEKNIE